MATYRSSKTFRGFPCAHRKWRHDGHCAWVHGYSREFIVWFAAKERDAILERNGNYRYPGYFTVAWRYLLKPWTHPAYPL